MAYDPEHVKQFQASAGIKVDGIVGPQTLGAGYTEGWQPRAPGPSGSEAAGWANQRRVIGDTYGNTTARIGFDRANAEMDNTYNVEALARQYMRMRDRMPGQFASRGLVGSGIQLDAQQRAQEDQGVAETNLARMYQRQLGDLSLRGNEATTNYTSGIAGVDLTEAARRADLAASIRGLV